MIEMTSPVVAVYVRCEFNVSSRYFSRGFEVMYGIFFNSSFSEGEQLHHNIG